MPEPEETDQSPLPKPALIKEPIPLLFFGIVFFLCVLIYQWVGTASQQRYSKISGQVMSSYDARVTTFLAEAAYYKMLRGNISPDLTTPLLIQLAERAAKIWEAAAREDELPVRKGQQLLNAAALYGVIKSFSRAQLALSSASQCDPLHQPEYIAFSKLYSLPSPQPVNITPEMSSLIEGISTEPLLRARNEELQGDYAGMAAALHSGAAAGLRITRIFAAIALVMILIFSLSCVLWLRQALSRGRPLFPVTPTTAPLPPWGIGMALTAISLHIIITHGLVNFWTFMVKSQGILSNSDTEIFIPFIAVGVSAVVVVTLLLAVSGKPGQWQMLGWRVLSGGWKYGVLAIILVDPLVWAASLISSALIGQEAHPLIPILFAVRDTRTLLVIIFGSTVIAPLVEETLYRGILFRACQCRLPFWSAAFLSGLLFALVHGMATYILPVTLLGVTFAWLTRQTGNLRASTVAHGIFNGLTTLAAVMLSRAIQ